MRQINNVFNSSAKQLIVLSDGEAWPSDLYARNTSWHNYYGVYFQTSEWGRRYGYLPGVIMIIIVAHGVPGLS